MPSVCICFSVHQPFRLRPFTYTNRRDGDSYFNDELNRTLVREAAEHCYLPANELILQLIEESGGSFRVSYAISGLAIEQFISHSPETLISFQRIAQTGCVEFVGETYYHSLASLYDFDEFDEQIAEHRNVMRELFGQRPTVFRNTGLIYNDDIGQHLSAKGYGAVLVDGAGDSLSPNFVYQVPGTRTALLLRNDRGLDEKSWAVDDRNGDVINAFLDYADFGGQVRNEAAARDFVRHLSKRADLVFQTPTQVVGSHARAADLSCPNTTALARGGLSEWNGNRMQTKSIDAVYGLKCVAYGFGGSQALDTWRKLQSADHFRNMSTKSGDEAAASSSPFKTPYDAFITYSQVLRDFAQKLDARAAAAMAEVVPEPLWFQPILAGYWPRRSYAQPKHA